MNSEQDTDCEFIMSDEEEATKDIPSPCKLDIFDESMALYRSPCNPSLRYFTNDNGATLNAQSLNALLHTGQNTPHTTNRGDISWSSSLATPLTNANAHVNEMNTEERKVFLPSASAEIKPSSPDTNTADYEEEEISLNKTHNRSSPISRLQHSSSSRLSKCLFSPRTSLSSNEIPSPLVNSPHYTPTLANTVPLSPSLFSMPSPNVPQNTFNYDTQFSPRPSNSRYNLYESYPSFIQEFQTASPKTNKILPDTQKFTISPETVTQINSNVIPHTNTVPETQELVLTPKQQIKTQVLKTPVNEQIQLLEDTKPEELNETSLIETTFFKPSSPIIGKPKRRRKHKSKHGNKTVDTTFNESSIIETSIQEESNVTKTEDSSDADITLDLNRPVSPVLNFSRASKKRRKNKRFLLKSKESQVKPDIKNEQVEKTQIIPESLDILLQKDLKYEQNSEELLHSVKNNEVIEKCDNEIKIVHENIAISNNMSCDIKVLGVESTVQNGNTSNIKMTSSEMKLQKKIDKSQEIVPENYLISTRQNEILSASRNEFKSSEISPKVLENRIKQIKNDKKSEITIKSSEKTAVIIPQITIEKRSFEFNTPESKTKTPYLECTPGNIPSDNSFNEYSMTQIDRAIANANTSKRPLSPSPVKSLKKKINFSKNTIKTKTISSNKEIQNTVKDIKIKASKINDSKILYSENILINKKSPNVSISDLKSSAVILEKAKLRPRISPSTLPKDQNKPMKFSEMPQELDEDEDSNEDVEMLLNLLDADEALFGTDEPAKEAVTSTPFIRSNVIPNSTELNISPIKLNVSEIQDTPFGTTPVTRKHKSKFNHLKKINEGSPLSMTPRLKNQPAVSTPLRRVVLEINETPIEKYKGLSTASGTKVKFSEKVLLKSQEIFNNENLTQIPEENEVSLPLEPKQLFGDDVQQENNSVGFSTAAGKAIKSSTSAVEKAKQLFGEDLQDATTITLYEEKVEESIETEAVPSFVGFSTAAGKAIKSSTSAMEKAKQLFGEDLQDATTITLYEEKVEESIETEAVPSFVGFSTAAGKAIKPSTSAVEKAKQLFGEDLRDATAITLYEEKVEESIETEAVPSFVGFSTAAGKAIKSFTSAVEKAKQLFGEDLQDATTITLYEEKVEESIETEAVPSFVGFSTAAGKAIKSSTSAMEKAKQLFGEDLQDATTITLYEEKVEESIETEAVPSFVGFSTAAGKAIKPSTSAVEKAKQLFGEDLRDATAITLYEEKVEESIETEAVPSFVGFSTAAGKIIKPSTSAMEKAKQLFREDIRDDTAFISYEDEGEESLETKAVPSFVGFSTAAGKAIKPSTSAMEKAKQLFCEDLQNVNTASLFEEKAEYSLTKAMPMVSVAEEKSIKSPASDVEKAKLLFCKEVKETTFGENSTDDESLIKLADAFTELTEKNQVKCAAEKVHTDNIKVNVSSRTDEDQMDEELIEQMNKLEESAIKNLTIKNDNASKTSQEKESITFTDSEKLTIVTDNSCNISEQTSEFQGFKTVSGKNLNVSCKDLEIAQKLFQNLENETENLDNKSNNVTMPIKSTVKSLINTPKSITVKNDFASKSLPNIQVGHLNHPLVQIQTSGTLVNVKEATNVNMSKIDSTNCTPDIKKKKNITSSSITITTSQITETPKTAVKLKKLSTTQVKSEEIVHESFDDVEMDSLLADFCENTENIAIIKNKNITRKEVLQEGSKKRLSDENYSSQNKRTKLTPVSSQEDNITQVCVNNIGSQGTMEAANAMLDLISTDDNTQELIKSEATADIESYMIQRERAAEKCTTFDDKGNIAESTADNDMESGINKTNVEQELHVDSISLQPQEFQGFATASGKKVAISEDAILAAKQRFVETDRDLNYQELETSEPPVFRGFATASGKKVAISEDAILAAKKRFAETDKDITNQEILPSEPPVFQGFATASGKKVAISEDAILAAKKRFAETDKDITDQEILPSEPQKFQGFATASGKKVAISEDAILAAKKRFAETDKDITDQEILPSEPQKFQGFATASGKKVAISENAILAAKKRFAETDKDVTDQVILPSEPQKFQGFATASGKKVAISDDAILAAKKRFAESDKDITDLEILSSEPQKFQGFATASGKKVAISENAILAAKKRFAETDKDVTDQETSEPQEFQGFATASGEKVAISEDAILAAKKRLGDIEECELNQKDTSPKLQHFQGFATASGSKVSISEKSLAAARERYAETKTEGFKVKVSDESVSVAKFTETCSEVMKDKRKRKFEELEIDNSVAETLETKPKELVNKKVSVDKVEDINSQISLETSQSQTPKSPILTRKIRIPLRVKKQYLEAREKQKVMIQNKKSETIKLIPGTILNVKRSDKKLIKLKEINEENSQVQIRDEILYINSMNAESYRFKLQQITTYSDGAILIPSNSGEVGVEEIELAFLASPGVDPKLVPPGEWVRNHYRWIVWKLASTERRFPEQFNNYLSLENVMAQLKFRYDREVDLSQRPAIRRITEQDSSPGSKIIVCVAEINLNVNSEYIILTDNWYQIKAKVDEEMLRLLRNKKIIEGTKLIIYGAEFINKFDACHPLQQTENIALKISTNSTRRARWDALLGFYKDPSPINISLNSVLPYGGLIGEMWCSVARVYPIMYAEHTLVQEGVNRTVIRGERAEKSFVYKYERERHKVMEKIVAEEKSKLYKEKEKEAVKRRHSFNAGDLRDGETLCFALECDPDLHTSLTDSQRDIASEWGREEQERWSRRLEDKIRERVKSESKPRSVSMLLKLRLVPVDAYEPSCILTIWRPNPDIVKLVNTDNVVIKLYNCVAAGRRNRELCINTTKNTKILEACPMELHDNLIRHVTPICKLDDINFQPIFNEIDLVGVITNIEPIQSNNLQLVTLCDATGYQVIVCFWGGIESQGLSQLLIPGVSISAINLQWRKGIKKNLSNNNAMLPCLQASEFSQFSRDPNEMYLKVALQELRTNLDPDVTIKNLKKCIPQVVKPDNTPSKVIEQKLNALARYGEPPPISPIVPSKVPAILFQTFNPPSKIEEDDSPPMSLSQ